MGGRRNLSAERRKQKKFLLIATSEPSYTKAEKLSESADARKGPCPLCRLRANAQRDSHGAATSRPFFLITEPMPWIPSPVLSNCPRCPGTRARSIL